MTQLPQTLMTQLADAGLMPLGGFAIQPDDDLPLDHGTLLLIGPDEPRFWTVFSQSSQYLDSRSNPLDRWSQATLDPIAKQAGGHAVYPFGGPPYQPFYSWALRSGRAWTSPIAFLVHDTAGLFVSYRGALVLPWDMYLKATEKPCDTCVGQPCKTACPVDAFTDGYDVAACKTYLPGTDCMATGCAARRACPIGKENRIPAQAAFHMKAFL